MSTDCTFYDPATGAITSVMQLSDETLEHYVTTGAHVLLDVKGDPMTQYVVNNVLVDFTPDELTARATAALPTAIAAAIAKPYADIDAVVRDAVGNRTEEYKDAEADARTYRAAGYVGSVPPSVDCFAQHNPTGTVQTGQWAADDIITRADAFAAAKLAMRQNRFASQSAMRAATTPAALAAAAAGWNGFITALRAQLGLP